MLKSFPERNQFGQTKNIRVYLLYSYVKKIFPLKWYQMQGFIYLIPFFILLLGSSCTYNYRINTVAPFVDEDNGVIFTIMSNAGEEAYLLGTFSRFEQNKISMAKINEYTWAIKVYLEPGVYFYYYQIDDRDYRDVHNPTITPFYENNFINVLILDENHHLIVMDNQQQFNKTQIFDSSPFEIIYYPRLVNPQYVEILSEQLKMYLNNLKNRTKLEIPNRIQILLQSAEHLNFSPAIAFSTMNEERGKFYPIMVLRWFAPYCLNPGENNLFPVLATNELFKCIMLYNLNSWIHQDLSPAQTLESFLLEEDQSFFYWIIEGLSLNMDSQNFENNESLLFHPHHSWAAAAAKEGRLLPIRDYLDLSLQTYWESKGFIINFISNIGSFCHHLLEEYSLSQVFEWIRFSISEDYISAFNTIFGKSLDQEDTLWNNKLGDFAEEDPESVDALSNLYGGTTHLLGLKLYFFNTKAYFQEVEQEEGEDSWDHYFSGPPPRTGVELIKVEGYTPMEYYYWFNIWFKKKVGDPISITYKDGEELKEVMYYPEGSRP